MTYFGRAYRLEIGTGEGGDPLIYASQGLADPLQVEFMVDQTPNANRAFSEITVYGLNRDSRQRIYERGASILLKAGWQSEAFGQIFAGQINNIGIGRSGSDQFLRLYSMSSVDKWQSATLFKTFPSGTEQIEIIRAAASQFGLPVEVYGDFSDLPPAINGETIKTDARSALRRLSRDWGFNWYITNGRTFIVKDDATNPDVEPVAYTPANGIIGTPEITDLGVNIDVLLAPTLAPNDTYTVESETGALSVAGVYYQNREFPKTQGESVNRIVSMKHEGDYYGDTWQTSLEGQRR